MIYNIQGLRAFAALSVLYAHLASTSALSLRPNVGVFGVDLFFVISGFLIPYVADAHAGLFALRRLIRIVPLYWTVTLFLFAVARTVPALFHSIKPTFGQLVGSLLFLPYPPLKGPFPVVSFGWTLNYEMYFYAIFASALLAGKRFAPAIAATVIAVVFAVVRLLGDTAGAFAFFGNSIVFEFVFGILCFYGLPAIKRLPSGPSILVATVALLAISVAALPLSEIATTASDGPRWALMGVPAWAVVLCALVLELKFGISARNRGLLAAADSSYALYLTHVYVITALVRLLPSDLASGALRGVLILPLTGAALAAAFLLHQRYERPLRISLQQTLLPTSS
jgi:exopolysaccharide production protein ExoZ